jgi:hypothetical protein
MSRTVSFSFSTEEEKKSFEEYARLKGMKLSVLAKMATFQYLAKYPIKVSKIRGLGKQIDYEQKIETTVQPIHENEIYDEEKTLSELIIDDNDKPRCTGFEERVDNVFLEEME